MWNAVQKLLYYHVYWLSFKLMIYNIDHQQKKNYIDPCTRHVSGGFFTMTKSLHGDFGNDQRSWNQNAFYISCSDGSCRVVIFNVFPLLGVGFWHVSQRIIENLVIGLCSCFLPFSFNASNSISYLSEYMLSVKYISLMKPCYYKFFAFK